jgi:hypothetical protein
MSIQGKCLTLAPKSILLTKERRKKLGFFEDYLSSLEAAGKTHEK